MAVVADWRKETDKKICRVMSDLHRLLAEAKASGDKGNICIEKLPYWPGGNFGELEAARSVKVDLTKVA